MKLVGKHGLSGILEIALWIVMVAGAAIVVTLPWSISSFMMPYNNQPDYWYPRYLITLSVSGVLAELVLWQVRGIVHNVNVGTIFTMNTVKRFIVAGVETLVVALFYLVMTLCGMTKFTMLVIFVAFLLVGLMLLVFSELFRQAIKYKQENEMTI